jgi:hypothetical protein
MPYPTTSATSNPLRLRTLDLDGMPVEINGVQFPVQQWDISYSYPGQPVEVRLNLLVDFAPEEAEPETDCCESPLPGCRYIAEIVTAAGGYDHVDCDTASIDKRGYLRLDLAEVKDVACYSPGTWNSYRLIAPPKAAPNTDDCCAAPEPESDDGYGIFRERLLKDIAVALTAQ